MKIYVWFISTLLMAFVLTGCGNSNEAKTIIEDQASFKDLKVQSNKTYTLTTTDNTKIILNLDNNVLTSKDLNGKVTVINFWATWCRTCIEEMPILNRLYEKHSDKFNLIGVLFKDKVSVEQIEAYRTKLNMKFPVTTGDSEDDRLAYFFDDIKMVPESFVFDKNGKFIKKFIGVVEEEELEALITQ